MVSLGRKLQMWQAATTSLATSQTEAMWPAAQGPQQHQRDPGEAKQKEAQLEATQVEPRVEPAQLKEAEQGQLAAKQETSTLPQVAVEPTARERQAIPAAQMAGSGEHSPVAIQGWPIGGGSTSPSAQH